MNTKVAVIMVHGMGSHPEWFNSFIAPIQELGCEPIALTLPDLNCFSPDTWVDTVAESAQRRDVVLIGHSLGAAVCLAASHRIKPLALILLAMPPFSRDYTPRSPDVDLSATAKARCGVFIFRTAVANEKFSRCDIIHFVGSMDEFVPVDRARMLGFTLEKIEGRDHDLNRSRHLIRRIQEYLCQVPALRNHLDPGFRYSILNRHGEKTVSLLSLDTTAPQPVRLDIEITTRCQLSCKYCARTLYRRNYASSEMSERMFENIIGQAPSVRELFFVGLGEPLLHNQLETFVACAHQRNITTRLVTNGLAADSGRLVKLRARGLSEVTFSIDTTDPALFKKLRSNADLSIILDNIRGVPAGLTRSLFVTLSKNNIDSLPGIIDLASELSLPAIAFSDLNFPQNLHDTVAAFPQTDTLLSNIRYAHNKNILLITPHFHNYGGPLRNYFQTCMVRNPEDICKRTTFHRNCLAPWRIAVVDVHGNVNPCNCTPQDIVGNLVGQPFADVWNGENIQSWRNGVLCGTNVVCQSCPRY